MNHGSAGEIENTPFVEESIRVPSPVSQRGVNEQRKEADENHVAREANALGERTRDEGRSNDRELQLKESEEREWNRR